jgi:dCTP deaminase
MILTGIAIDEAVGRGEIVIDPYDQSQLNPASYDLRLGDEVAVYDQWVDTSARYPSVTGAHLRAGVSGLMDVMDEPAVTKFKIGPGGWVLVPGIGYLMHTKERVLTSKYVPVLDGKSSTGRLFISIHETAGFGDVFFDGQYTLEVTCKHPVLVRAGMLFAQIRFHRMEGPITPYKGNYTGDAARGPVASRAWKQFKEKEKS